MVPLWFRKPNYCLHVDNKIIILKVNAAESEIIESFLSVGMIMRLPDFKAVFDNIIENLKQTDDDLSYVTIFNFIERIGNRLVLVFPQYILTSGPICFSFTM